MTKQHLFLQVLTSNWILYHVDLEKRGECGVVAREKHESRISQ